MSSKYSNSDLITLIDHFVSGTTLSADFEREFIEAWRLCRDNGQLQIAPENDQQYFDAVFCAIDNYCADPELRDGGEFDDQMLIDEVLKLKTFWEAAKAS